MIKYIIKRLLMMIPILISVSILIFILMDFVPGDPARIALSNNTIITEADLAAKRAQLGLDKPFLTRLLLYLKGIFFHLDFGTSYTYGTSTGAEIMSRFPTTLLLAFSCTLTMVVIGAPLGIRAAVKANTFEDKLSMFITLLGNCMPNFWLALMLVLVFSLRLGWLPSSGINSWKNYVLPIVAGSLSGVAAIARQTRASMLEVIRSDYVTTATAKGLSANQVIFGHALPNALIPVITICGQQFGFMMGGISVIEMIFSIPGIGSFLITSINQRDYPCVEGCIVYIAFCFSIMMLITDLIYAFVDPRIKAGYISKNKKRTKQ